MIEKFYRQTYVTINLILFKQLRELIETSGG